MDRPIDHFSRLLPEQLPVGASYVVEGYGGETGNLRVISRYVLLPDGRRINVPAISGSQPPGGVRRVGVIACSARRKTVRSQPEKNF
jgi:hypothetical protein